MLKNVEAAPAISKKLKTAPSLAVAHLPISHLELSSIASLGIARERILLLVAQTKRKLADAVFDFGANAALE